MSSQSPFSDSHENDGSNNKNSRLVESLWFESERGGKRHVLGSGILCREDRQEILHWSAGYSDLIGGYKAVNLSFHPLPSGKYCLSRTRYAPDFSTALVGKTTNEQEKRPNLIARMFTHAWIITPETLRYFGNQPLSIYSALKHEKIGCCVARDGFIPAEVLSVKGTVGSIIRSLAKRSKSSLPSGEFDVLLEQTSSLIIYGKSCLLPWLNNQLNVMSAAQRNEISFCTSLKFSSKRPFKLTGIGKSKRELNRVNAKYLIPVWDVRRFTPTDITVEGKPFADPELIQIWECLKESFLGNRDKCNQSIQLWNQYRQTHSSSVESARESLLEWSTDAYRGLGRLQNKQPRQIRVMLDMLDALLQ